MLLFISLVFCLPYQSWGSAYDIMQYGAKGDGQTDDTKAFEEAWQDLCNDVEPWSSLVIPLDHVFLVGPIEFHGPCKSNNIHFEILGTITAFESHNSWHNCETETWLSFENVNDLLIDGGGMIDGRGHAWWTKSLTSEKQESKCSQLPTALRFEKCNRFQLRQLRHRDSAKNHISISRCSYSNISNIDIEAPRDSPNTDGINIAFSTEIQIYDSIIKTGDDCIAVNTGSSQIYLTGINCGPGHGISIGSLGKNNHYDTVEGVHVKYCNFTKTTNGARIKTWQGGSGYAKDITFEHIELNDVKNPILIDQYYCPHKKDCPTKLAAVEVNNIHYSFFQGTSSTRTAINFNCSNSVPCWDISLNQINIISSVLGKDPIAECNDAYGTFYDTKPIANCLLH